MHHGAGLQKLTGSATLAKSLADAYETAPITEAERAMLRYADKLTRTPAGVTQADVDELLRCGFSDGAVLDICMVVGYFAFVNRLADGLGVEPEQAPE